MSGDAKSRAAHERYRLEAVSEKGFDEAYGALAAEFGPRGELERREVIRGFLDRSSYHLLVARDRDGRLAGVRDCHLIVDREERIAVVYLAHALVLPGFRRTGLGALLRSAPLTLGVRAVSEAGLGQATPT